MLFRPITTPQGRKPAPSYAGITLDVLKVAGLLMLAVAALLSMTNNDAATRTSLEIQALPCDDLEPLWLQAQAVPSASLVPCVHDLPVGWSFGSVAVNDGRVVQMVLKYFF